MNRLTADELSDLLGCANDKYEAMNRRDVISAVAELRERRAADLTSKDVEALRWLREKGGIKTAHHTTCSMCHDSTWDHECDDEYEDIPEAKRALAVLDKLIAAHGAK